MRRVIAAINMTLDGVCDHTAVDPDEQIHDHYTQLVNDAGAMIYGRITYQLMESFWPEIVKNPTGVKSTDDFAAAIHNVPKIVFSRSLKSLEWEHARLADKDVAAEIAALRQQPGKDIFIGSPGMIVSCMNLNLIDEYQICVHPVVAGGGSLLFKNVSDRTALKLVKTKTFDSGAVILYYQPVNK